MTVRVRDTMTASLVRQQRAIGRIPQLAYEYFVAQTPRRTGNARRSTRLVGSEIQARYAYAEVLDSGSSTQAPQGMTQPTLREVERLYDQATRK